MNTAEKQVFDALDVPIGGVMPEQLLTVWPKVEPILARVVKPQTGYDLESVLTGLQLGMMQLWVIGDFLAVVVTTIQTRPLHNVLFMQFVAGTDMDSWLDDWITLVDEFARQQGCAAIEFGGRKGWNRRLARSHPEYKPILTIFRREF